MIPNIDPRQLKHMMRSLGMSQEDVDSKEVQIIKNDGTKIVINNPSVQKIVMQGQTSFQISGEVVEKTDFDFEISDEDIQMVLEGAQTDKQTAKLELEKTKGDIAEAISNLKGGED